MRSPADTQGRFKIGEDQCCGNYKTSKQEGCGFWRDEHRYNVKWCRHPVTNNYLILYEGHKNKGQKYKKANLLWPEVRKKFLRAHKYPENFYPWHDGPDCAT